LPDAVIVFSPWIDVELTGKTPETNAATNTIISRENIPRGAQMWLAGESPMSPLVNPYYADISGCPPMYITAGSHEVFLDEEETLAEIKASGLEVKLEVSDGLQHVYVFMVGRAPEANTTFNQVGEWIKPKLKE
jgi:monoterpene epsilon-lactone hydrolase